MKFLSMKHKSGKEITKKMLPLNTQILKQISAETTCRSNNKDYFKTFKNTIKTMFTHIKYANDENQQI